MEHDISGIVVLDELRAVPNTAGDGVIVEVRGVDGRIARIGIHRLAVGAVAACLLEAVHRAPTSPFKAPSARVPADAVGVTRSEDGETLLVLETGSVSLAYALSKEALSGIREGLDATSSMRGDLPARHPLIRRHEA